MLSTASPISALDVDDEAMRTDAAVLPAALPAEGLDDGIAIVGTAGSGKTYPAKGYTERLLDMGGRATILDPRIKGPEAGSGASCSRCCFRGLASSRLAGNMWAAAGRSG
jgi:hypothetical protein